MLCGVFAALKTSRYPTIEPKIGQIGKPESVISIVNEENEMCLNILLLVFGIIALAKGEFKITNKRMVKGSTGRILGVIMLLGVAVPYATREYGGLIQLVLLVIVIIIGLATSENIEEFSEEKKSEK